MHFFQVYGHSHKRVHLNDSSSSQTPPRQAATPPSGKTVSVKNCALKNKAEKYIPAGFGLKIILAEIIVAIFGIFFSRGFLWTERAGTGKKVVNKGREFFSLEGLPDA